MKKGIKEIASENNSRRDFLKLSGALSSAALLSSPLLAMAEPSEEKGKVVAADRDPRPGKGFKPANIDFKPEEIGKALKVVFKTYSTTRPYQHKFNDALTKSWLNAIDFAVSKKQSKEFIEHYINMMMPILLRGKMETAKYGKDTALTTMFDGTMCSIQLFEEINVKENERTFPCPYVGILEACKPLKMFSIEWKDVCNNLCIPLYTGFGKAMDLEVKMTPGEICKATI